MPCNCNRANNYRCCRQIAVRVDRIYNGARREQTVTRTLSLDNLIPPNPAPPLTYLNGGYTGEATVTALSASPIVGSSRNRLTVDYCIPVTIDYTDAGGNFGRASAVLCDTVDLILTMPACPYTVEVETVFQSRIGTISGNVAEITGCMLTIIRVMVKCDIIIDNPRYVTYPLATLTEDEACAGLFERLNR